MVPRWIRYAPPPYSWTVVRTLNPDGVTSTGSENGAACISTDRPSSVGLLSCQYTEPSSSHGFESAMPPTDTISALMGDLHVPYGAVCVTPGAWRRSPW